ncbi:uncharacterized protein CIMG_05353 [Coccidioides immitis RS]|uniref:Uncharacterized protein n=1 Tax=Coccidioides immitis (strain RS) TaxID=246410 RepID=J3KFD9_COCIM|nr:uncharacterized protein CIMG_05353 [Coccidioides immitis RS]EAS34329.3 hypothetical protein CIMG_05353 [Coccidioides immitis RS]
MAFYKYVFQSNSYLPNLGSITNISSLASCLFMLLFAVSSLLPEAERRFRGCWVRHGGKRCDPCIRGRANCVLVDKTAMMRHVVYRRNLIHYEGLLSTSLRPRNLEVQRKCLLMEVLALHGAQDWQRNMLLPLQQNQNRHETLKIHLSQGLGNEYAIVWLHANSQVTAARPSLPDDNKYDIAWQVLNETPLLGRTSKLAYLVWKDMKNTAEIKVQESEFNKNKRWYCTTFARYMHDQYSATRAKAIFSQTEIEKLQFYAHAIAAN